MILFNKYYYGLLLIYLDKHKKRIIMKKKIFTILTLAIFIGIAQTGSSTVINSKVSLKAASVRATANSTWYNYGYADGAYDRAQGNPYQTSFNPPTDRDDKKEYQTGYISGFNGGN
jgi:hypothetical protein